MTPKSPLTSNPLILIFGCVLASSALLAATGCGISNVLPSSDPVTESSGTISGTVHGGQNPISGATVTIYIAGLTGYGSGPASGTFLAQTTTDANGNFTFGSYTCPTPVSPATANDELEYIVSTQGNSGAGNNSAISLMAVLGGPQIHGSLLTNDTCAAVKASQPDLQINEETTIASMFALAQFYNPSTGYIGTSATNYQGLINAVNIASELVTTASGTVNTSFQPQGANLTPIGGSSTYTNTVGTPDADKIALLADIIATCVNSTGPGSTACSTLFQYAVPPPTPATTTLGSAFTYPAATNTLTAAYYLAVNPTNATTAGVANTTAINKLYSLPQPNAPFIFTEAQPTDWTLSVVYSSPSYGGGTVGFISAPTYLSVDASGNVAYLTSSTTTSNESIAELNPYGGLAAFALTSLAPFQGYIIDGSNYGYLARSGTTATARTTYTLTGAVTNKYNDQIEDSNDANLVFQPSQFASDGTYLFMTTATSGDAGSIFQVPGTGQTGSPFTSSTTTTSPFAALNAGNTIGSLTTTSPIAVDSAKHVYVAAGNALYQTTYTTTLPSGAIGATPTLLSGTFVTPAGMAVDHSNNVWITNAAGGSPANGYLSYYNAGTSTVVQDTTAGDGGINNPAGVAIDGAGNVWVASAGSGTSFTGQTVNEFALIGGNLTALSPSVGYVHNYSKPGSIAVDLSGNVWVANTGVATNTGTSTSGSVTCILGAASPVVTPIAKGIQSGTQGTLP